MTYICLAVNERSPRRDRVSILANMLEAAITPVPRTRIMYQANLSFAMNQRYVSLLLRNELLETCSPLLRTTGKGRIFLQKYKEMMECLRK